MTNSRMNYHLHKVIIRLILDISFDPHNITTTCMLLDERSAGPKSFMYTLDLICKDFQDFIHLDDGRFMSVKTIARRPETSVLDIWRIWSANNRSPVNWWKYGMNNVTGVLVNELFKYHDTVYGLAETQCFLDNITWGTLSRYLRFIKNNCVSIPDTVERECSQYNDKAFFSKRFIGTVGKWQWHDWCQKFNADEEEHVKSICSDLALELGYKMRLIKIVDSEPVIEPIPVQKDNKSMTILHTIITLQMITTVMLSFIIWRVIYVGTIN
jgi:hypothetical protein